MYKQIIIARKDLNMSAGKLAAQCSHASMAFLTTMIRNNNIQMSMPLDYMTNFTIDKDLYEQWIDGEFTKVILQAKNKNNLMKAVELAKSLGMTEGEDYFLIYDSCRTELTPEFIDKNGIGRILTCVGFKPMDSKIIDQIGRKFHTYIG